MKKDLKDQEDSITQLEDRAYDLELNLDSLEQYTRKYNVEIHGIPEKRDENLKDVITSITSKLDVDIRSHIRHCSSLKQKATSNKAHY